MEIDNANYAEVNVVEVASPVSDDKDNEVDNGFAPDLHGTDISNDPELSTIEAEPGTNDTIVDPVDDQNIEHDHVEMSNTEPSVEEDENEDETDVTDKVKNEEMNIGRNIIRRQIFIPEVQGKDYINFGRFGITKHSAEYSLNTVLIRYIMESNGKENKSKLFLKR